MFDIGLSEMLIIAAIALIAIGPKQLPEIARAVGKFMADLKRSTSDITETFASAHKETRQTLVEARKTAEDAFADALNSVNSPLAAPTKAETAPETQPDETKKNLPGHEAAKQASVGLNNPPHSDDT